MLELAPQPSHLLAVDRLRAGAEDALDRLHGVGETRRQTRRGGCLDGAFAAHLELEQPAPGTVFAADAMNLQRADLVHRRRQLHPHLALPAAGGCVDDGGDWRQTDELLVGQRRDLAGLIRRVGD